MATSLEKEFDYYIENQEELVTKYNGKFLLIKDCTVVGQFDDELEAVLAGKEKYEAGTFLVQKVSPGDDEYSQAFHSRVAFS